MAKKIYTTALIILYFINYGQSQLAQSPNPYQKLLSEYQKSIYQDNKDSIFDGTSAKISRWQKFWEPRIGKDGNYTEYYNTMAKNNSKNFVSVSSSCTNNCSPGNCFQANWNFIGPEDFQFQTNGKINAIWVNPTNSNHILAGAEGGLWKSVDGGQNWINLTGFCLPGIGVSAIAVPINNINVIYIGTSYGFSLNDDEHNYGYGLFKSSDGGNTWSQLSAGSALPPQEKGCLKVYVHPGNTNVIYAAIGHGIYKSVNSGLNWVNLFNAIDNPNKLEIYDFELNPQSTIQDEIYISSRSKIAGWSCITPTPLVTYCFGSTLRFTAQVWKLQINTTATSGHTVTNITSTIPGYLSQTHLSSVAVNNSSINIACNTGLYPIQEIKIFKKIGLSPWQITNSTLSLNLGLKFNYSLPFEVSQVNSNIYYLGGNVLYKSINGGTLFTNLWSYWSMFSSSNYAGSHPDIRATYLYNSNTTGNDVLYFGTDGGISKTIDGGQTTLNLNGKGLELTQIVGLSNSEKYPNLIYAGTQDNGVFSNPLYWLNSVQNYGDGYDAVSDVINPQIAYCTNNAGNIYTTQNAGQTWTILSNSKPGGENCDGRPMFIENNNKLYVGSKNLWRRDGVIWTNITNFPPGDSRIVSFKITDDGNTAYIAYSGSLWNSIPLAANFAGKVFKISNLLTGPYVKTDITAGLEGIRWASITDLTIEPTIGASEKLFISMGGFWTPGKKVYKYQNNTWSEFGQGLPNIPCSAVEFVKDKNDLIFAGTDDGVYYRKNGMSAFVKFNCNLPNTIISDLEFNYKTDRLRAGTYSRGIWETGVPY